MSIRLDCSQQRLAEKLIIFNDRALGIITRLYYLKNASAEDRWNITSLADKKWEPLLKSIRKKFPSVEKSHIKSLSTIKSGILQTLSPYYYTMVDLLEFKDHVCDLFNIMNALSIRFNGLSNADLLCDYSMLVYRYVICFIMLNRLLDRRTILGLYAICSYPSRDTTYARVAQMIVDYENSVQKLLEDFSTHHFILESALSSMIHLHNSSISSEPGLIKSPLQLHSTLEISYWFTVMCFVCPAAAHVYFSSDGTLREAIITNKYLYLFRDEIIIITDFVNNTESIKGFKSKFTDTLMYEQKNIGIEILKYHRKRRMDLICNLSKMYNLLNENEFYVGPCMRDAIIMLEESRFEIIWLVMNLRENISDDMCEISDRFTCELIYYIEMIKEIVIKNKFVIGRYFCDYLAMFDAIELHLAIKELSNLANEYEPYVQGFIQTLDELSERKGDINEISKLHLGDCHLDWKRFQALTSQKSNCSQMNQSTRFIEAMHSITFHCQLIDNSDKLIKDSTDMSILFFSPQQFEHIFRSCIELPSRSNFCMACPIFCCSVEQNFNQLCPEEREKLTDMALGFIHSFLCEITKELKNLFFLYLREIISRTERAPLQNLNRYFKKQNQEFVNDDNFSIQNIDRVIFAIRQLCLSLTNNSTLICCNHRFQTVEYLTMQLETRFDKSLLSMLELDLPSEQKTDSDYICKPSMLRLLMTEFKNLAEMISDHISIDCLRVCSDVIVRGQRSNDFISAEHIQRAYVNWYCYTISLLASEERLLFSPIRRSFIINKYSLGNNSLLKFDPEEYTSPYELDALVEILGPDGIQVLTNQLINCCVGEFQNAKELAVQHIDLLKASELDPDSMLEWLKTLKSCQEVVTEEFLVLSSITKSFISIGVLLGLRRIIQISRKSVIQSKLPFIQSVSELTELPKEVADLTNIGNTDSMLASLLSQCKINENNVDITKLMFSTVALFLPAWLDNNSSSFIATISAHTDNAHCIPLSIDALSNALDSKKSQKYQFLFLRAFSFATIHYSFKSSNVFFGSIILIDKLVEECTYLKHGMLEPMIPRGLISAAYLNFQKDLT